MLAQENCDNSTTLQIDSQEKLMIEINNDLNRVLLMIIDIQKIYIKYLN